MYRKEKREMNNDKRVTLAKKMGNIFNKMAIQLEREKVPPTYAVLEANKFIRNRVLPEEIKAHGKDIAVPAYSQFKKAYESSGIKF